MSLNRVMLIGNVGVDPTIRYVEENVCTASFRLATTTPGYSLPNGTQVPERTEWHNILLWRGMAELIKNYVHKGDKLYVEGELRTRSYTDAKGVTRYITEIWGQKVELLSRRTSENSSTPSPNQQPAQSAPSKPADSSSDLPF